MTKTIEQDKPAKAGVAAGRCGKPPFAKILIANRGEIACRVIRTARAMGIKTVAVYSEADADALHVREADEAVAIGPPPSAQSYLVDRQDRRGRARRPAPRRCIRATASCRRTAPSPRRWRRPASSSSARRPRAIAAMGDKIESKKLAQKAGVSTVPGHLGVIKDADEAVKIARDDRLSGDDQGLGRRRRQGHAHRPQRRRGARRLPRAPRNEARSSFGDDRVFIEKYIEEPRHIEIQVLADAHGNMPLSRRARMLDPAPPPEGDRGGAEPVPRRQDARRRWASRRWRWPRPSATAPPARSSSSSTASAISTSSR